ncbi:MAG TPA: ABC transporter ATP-binding protein [Nocardioides sp.]|uniref:ABC transporter ATP-binding protein n=1 Tax=uncultured Nocardioides sp. TaxID=198441 RepID=UPI000EC8F23D|nr:ABC transporter ATP-binding protein [uncultured Nocardioides sp.]HCB06408.1 ABC transporter [Nocardioides sp.]HRD60098.1 ABC transporter ATP-binding protein [Nocardioides sp.]HRI95753.1 ABC transporter ATP-binding protein [Nocardioides sp.]HRK46193.1 ABC transporter ATP-binding protein [Nocardioides sp.]
MTSGPGAAAAWRHLRSDRSVVNNRIDRRTVGRIVRFARPHRKLLAVFLVVTVIDAAMVVVTPLLVKRIVDDGILQDDRRLVVELSLAMAAVAVFSAGLSVLAGWLSSRIGEGLIFDLRTRVFGHVQRQSLAFFTRTQTGALVSRLNNDVIGAQRAFTSTLSSTVANTIAVVVVGVTMVALSWEVTVLCLALFPILFLVSRFVSGRLAGLTRQQMDGNADLGNVMTERFNVGGAMLLKLFGRRAEEDQLFADKASVVRDLGVRISLTTRIFAASMMLVPALATALVYGVGGNLAISGTLTVGTLLALATLLLRLLGPLQGLSNVRIDVMTALVSFERVFEVLDLPSLIEEKPDAVVLPAQSGRLEFDRVEFTYPKADDVSLASLEAVARADSRDHAQVLHDISFRAAPGQMVALVGPSGAGKTTITHLVARLYDVGEGAVRVGGHDVRDVTLQSLEDVVGYVTQDAHMFHDTIRANLLYANPAATDPEVWEALEAAQIATLVRALPDGLQTVVGDRGYRLSGGERQRLAIARLLLKSPAIVVLDEATAHLDSESEAAVQRALDAALSGRTSLVIAHRLSTVRHADLILVVDGGRIVQSGTHVELLREGGLYADLYRTQFVADVPA